MPRYDYKCRVCGETFEALAPPSVAVMGCIYCDSTKIFTLALADRQLSAPSHIQIH